MTEAQSDLRVTDIAISQIQSNPFQARQMFDELALKELAASIKEKGVLQPVIVRPKDDGFELIAGERRVRACRLVARETVPAIIVDVPEQEAVEMAFIENLQRADLTPLEEARALAGLTDRYHGNRSRTAEAVGKSLGYVNDRLALLNLTEPVQRLVDNNQLNLAQAKVLLDIPNPQDQVRSAHLAVRRNLTVNQVKGMTQAVRRKPVSEKRAPSFPSFTAAIIRFYELVDSLEVEGFDQDQRQTVEKQIFILLEVLYRVSAKLKGGEEVPGAASATAVS